jgi:hypothetical protein
MYFVLSLLIDLCPTAGNLQWRWPTVLGKMIVYGNIRFSLNDEVDHV